jgi:hypothetical protein
MPLFNSASADAIEAFLRRSTAALAVRQYAAWLHHTTAHLWQSMRLGQRIPYAQA